MNMLDPWVNSSSSADYPVERNPSGLPTDVAAMEMEVGMQGSELTGWVVRWGSPDFVRVTLGLEALLFRSD